MWPEADSVVAAPGREQNELTICLETPETERRYIPRPMPLPIPIPAPREPIHVRREAERTAPTTTRRKT
jgi:hypothetical protein